MKLSESKSNPANFWIMMKSLSHNSHPCAAISGGKNICDAFNEYFISSGYIPENRREHSASCWKGNLGTFHCSHNTEVMNVRSRKLDL